MYILQWWRGWEPGNFVFVSMYMMCSLKLHLLKTYPLSKGHTCNLNWHVQWHSFTDMQVIPRLTFTCFNVNEMPLKVLSKYNILNNIGSRKKGELYLLNNINNFEINFAFYFARHNSSISKLRWQSKDNSHTKHVWLYQMAVLGILSIMKRIFLMLTQIILKLF